MNFSSFKKWLPGDKIVFTVDKKIVATAIVIGNYYYDDEFLWNNGLFPHRIKVSFDYVVCKDKWKAISDIRELLINSWGKSYGWGIQNQTPLNSEDGAKLIQNLNNDNELRYFIDNIDTLIAQAKKERLEEASLISSGKMKANERRYKPSVIEI
ncbi:MAG: hypothetical protein A2Y23_08735 [Clostridiales bacterium GWB2_37_7]|nr:MAG: hypothetical protein A2Y23_08735 [Clostridiales bacterium GWB2_37_7]